MEAVLPLQSSFLYQGSWSHAIDSLILGTMVRLKKEYGCDGAVFPSHFIFEAQSVIEFELGCTFEWFELVDRLHFLERRYITFNELLHIEGTDWNSQTNTIIVASATWATRLPENHLLGAYHSYGDPAYSQLCQLFAMKDDVGEIDATLIVLSDSVQSQALVCDAPQRFARPEEPGEVNSSHKFSLARRKLMFDEGGPLDLESTNKKAEFYNIPSANGKLERVEKKTTGRVLPREFPPKSPALAYSCGSSKPKTWGRIPRNPDI